MVILLNNADQSGDWICFQSTLLLNLKTKQTHTRCTQMKCLGPVNTASWPCLALGLPAGPTPRPTSWSGPVPGEVPGTPSLPWSWLSEGIGPGCQAVPCCPSPCSALTENRVIVRPYVCRVGRSKLFKQVSKHLDSHKTCLPVKRYPTVGCSHPLFH